MRLGRLHQPGGHVHAPVGRLRHAAVVHGQRHQQGARISGDADHLVHLALLSGGRVKHDGLALDQRQPRPQRPGVGGVQAEGQVAGFLHHLQGPLQVLQLASGVAAGVHVEEVGPSLGLAPGFAGDVLNVVLGQGAGDGGPGGVDSLSDNQHGIPPVTRP